MSIYYSDDKKRFDGITKDELLAALNDPRLPESFDVTVTHEYPGLAIISDDEERWYLGYIDLFDGEVVINEERGMQDGKNPFHHCEGVRFVASSAEDAA